MPKPHHLEAAAVHAGAHADHLGETKEDTIAWAYAVAVADTLAWVLNDTRSDALDGLLRSPVPTAPEAATA